MNNASHRLDTGLFLGLVVLNGVLIGMAMPIALEFDFGALMAAALVILWIAAFLHECGWYTALERCLLVWASALAGFALMLFGGP